jgi:phospholipid/cholesterol/gamma-HCH transport system ATP-binding protein
VSPILSLDRVCHVTDTGRQLLSNLTFSCYSTDFLCIVGGSGQGKSVTLKHLNGVLFPTTGSVHILGSKLPNYWNTDWVQLYQSIGLVFQDGAFLTTKDVFGNMIVALETTNWDLDTKKKRIIEVCDYLGIIELLPKEGVALSVGERKLVGIARALLRQPKILCYDEPTTGMDAILRNQLIGIMAQTHTTRELSIVVTHDMALVQQLATKVCFIHQGTSYFFGTTQDFFNNPDAYIQDFITKGLQYKL